MKYFDYIKIKRSTFESTIKAGLIAVLLGTGVVMAQFSEPTASPTGNNTDAIHVGSGKQIKAGGFWARSLATDSSGGKLCLDKNGLFDDTNCITNWSDTPNVPKCRMETSQVISAGFMPNLTTLSCDNMLSAASRSNGWTSTGSNHSTIVASSDGFPPSVCVFMRLVCTGLSVGPATSTVATTWPVANFTKSSNQCSDLIDNEPQLSKLTNPTATAGVANDIEYSKSGTYLAVAHNTTPFVSIYKRGASVYTKLTDPVGGLPAGNGQGVGITYDGKYIAVAHATTPFVTVYRSDPSDVFTKISGPTVAPAGNANAVAYSPDGKYMAVVHATSPFVTIYKRSGVTGETYTKLGNPLGGLPAGIGRSVKFTATSKYLVVAHDATPFVSVYKISTGDVFTKLANPTTLPAGNGLSVDEVWEADIYGNPTDIFNLVHAGSPYAQSYSIQNPDASDLPNADDTFTGYAGYPTMGVVTSKGGVSGYSTTTSMADKFAAASDGSPFINVYGKQCGAGKICIEEWYKLANPSPLPTASNGISISPDGKHIAIAFGTSPYLYVYQYPDGLIDYPNDPECGSWWDNTESTVEATVACSDSLDNDGDGRIDYASDLSGDGGCTSAADATE